MYGGSFDPVHRGHLALAHAAINQFHLSCLYVVPVFQPPHKAKTEASFAHRLAMARLAFTGWPEVVISDLEGQRGGVSYTIDSVEELRGRHPGDDLYLLVGADTTEEIKTWKEPERLAGLVRLLVAPRSRYSLKIELPWCLEKLTMEPVEVSATRVREAVREGRPIMEYVPAPVAEYIHRHTLYQTG